MGYRFSPVFNCLPAYVKDNVLHCDYLFPETGIEVAAEGIDFPEQYTHISNNRVAAYLTKGKFELVLRFDGTGCLVQNGYLRRSFLYKPLNKDWHAIQKGTVKNEVDDGFPIIYVKVNDFIVASVEYLPVSMCIKNYKSTLLFQMPGQLLPIVNVDDTRGKLCYKDTSAVLEGEQFWGKGFRVLGGYNIGRVGMFIESE